MQNVAGSSFVDSSTPLRTSQQAFDVRNESDVIALLRTIHQNPIDSDVKNHIRDLIFSYRQTPNATDFTALRELFLQLGLNLTEGGNIPSSVMSTHTFGDLQRSTALGIIRPKPAFVFKPPVTKTPEVVIPQKPIQPLEQKVAMKPEPVGVPSYKSEEPLTVVAPTLVPPITQFVSPVSLPIEPQVPTPAVASTETQHQEPALRIQEIKRLVNQKVGNPVNLIDANNAVGREYMTALLDAMKKTNGGQPTEANDAMIRLEKAFIAVQAVIAGGISPENATHQTASVISKTNPVPQHKETIAQEPLKTIAPDLAQEGNPVHITVVQEHTEKNTTQKKIAPSIPQETTLPVTHTPNAIQSVAEQKQLQDLLRVNREKDVAQAQEREASQIAAMDPLATPQVSAGLGQLLSEWGLFKSSGIFGTGPSGKDHVLFLKLAPLTMAVVIAGRFEGVTPKIKQSISDYMNGWRYEEGIIHELGETFEHYLRRVVYHILNKKR